MDVGAKFQNAGADYFSTLGGLSPMRVLGVVLELPNWKITPAHESQFALLASTEGLKLEAGRILPTVLGLVVLVCVFRGAVMKLLITPIGRQLIPRATKTLKHREKTLSVEDQFLRTLTRFENAGWEAIFYSMSSCFGLYVYSEAQWSVWPTTNFWDGWPLQPDDELSRWYYLLALAFYTQALGSLLFFDKPRSDYWEYLLHHLVTIFLISASYYTKIHR